jgi:hypothetical protein
MAHEVQIEELLAAYLTADISADERTAVERRLAEDPALSAKLNDLRNLLPLLRRGERQVTPAMLAELKDRIALLLSNKEEIVPIAQLLAAGTANDLSEQEQQSVQKLLKENPQALKEFKSLQAFSQFLDNGRASVSSQAASKLAQRLNGKLPTAAIAPLMPKATETVSMKLQNQPKTGTSTVRIYTAKESPWRSRAAAIAAAIVLAVGAFLIAQAVKQNTGPVATHEETDIRPDDRATAPQNHDSTPNDVTPEDQQNSAPRNTGDSPQNNQRPPAPEGETPPTRTPSIRTPDREAPRAPQNRDDSGNSRDEQKPGTPELEKPKGTLPDAPMQEHLDPKDKPSMVERPPSPPNGVIINPTQQPAGNSPGPANGNGNGNDNDQQQALKKPNSNQQNNQDVQPVLGSLVAAEVADGNVQATMPDNTQVTVQVAQALPSGTTVTTDIARANFVLPGNGRLQVHRKSSMKVTLANLDTTVQLAAGQFHYKAPPGGSLTVNARSIVVSRATGSVMVTIGTDGSVITNVIENSDKAPVVVAPTGSQKQTAIPSGKQALSKTDNDTTTVGPPDDTLAEGLKQDIPDKTSDGGKTLAPADDPNDPSNKKSKGNSRRKH